MADTHAKQFPVGFPLLRIVTVVDVAVTSSKSAENCRSTRSGSTGASRRMRPCGRVRVPPIGIPTKVRMLQSRSVAMIRDYQHQIRTREIFLSHARIEGFERRASQDDVRLTSTRNPLGTTSMAESAGDTNSEHLVKQFPCLPEHRELL
jgi:hypothetical protein